MAILAQGPVALRMFPPRWPSFERLAGSRLVAGLVARDQRWRARAAMRRIDDRILRDIGVSRGDFTAALRALR